jgi:diguanylate cyclase (GGDEF)-like protein/PAS domain S-box-containing protein
MGDPRPRTRPREGAGDGPVLDGREGRAKPARNRTPEPHAGGERPPKPTRKPRAGTAVGAPPVDVAAGAPSLDAATGGTEIGRLLVDHISDAVFSTDATNRVTHWTASAARLFGYSAGEAIGHPFGELLPFGMDRSRGEPEFLTELQAGRTWRGTGTVLLRDGSEIWIESTVQPIMADGRLVGSVSVSRDISATVEAQRRLAEEERFITAVLDVAGALVLVLDAQGRVVRFNGACERLTGYLSEELVGRPIWDVVIPPSQGDDVRGVVADLQAGAFPNSHENHWVTRDGALRLIAWENTCLTDEQGAVTHVIATGIDITEARRGEEALHGIETVGRLLAEQGPVPAALDAVLGELEERMGYRFLSLYLCDGRGLRLGAQRGYRAVPERLEAGSGVIGRVYRTGRGALVADVRTDPDYLPGDDGVVAEIAVPLLGDDETLGVLNIESEQAGGLTPGDLRLARAIADRLATALLRNQEQEALRDRMRLFAALTEFAGVANAILDPQRLATALVDAVGAVVPSDTLVITTLDRTDGEYRVRAVRGLTQDAVGETIRPGDGNTGRAIAERAVVSVDRHERAQYSAVLRDRVPYEFMCGIAVPLIHEDAVLGVISVGRAGADATFTSAEREVIVLLGFQAALALANANLVEEVSALAIHDSLTGLYNRRHYDEALDRAIARFKRRGPDGNLAAIMFDLDHFGEFNRRHGHLVGDAVLRLFGGILRERLRSSDLVARYGGEEFVVILEDCGLAEAIRVADEIRRELEARSVPGADGQPLRATVSAGCAVIDRAEPTKEALLGRADVGLFMAKRAGRNQVVAA